MAAAGTARARWRPPLVLALALFVLGATACADKAGEAPPVTITPAPTLAPGAPRPPNIILILTDDQAAADFAFMPRTQALIAQQGISFLNYFNSVSLCCPSRTSILRGQYAHNHGVLNNAAPSGGYGVFKAKGLEASNVATWLQASGYRTALFGKYLNGYPGGKKTYVPPGWTGWYANVKGGTDAFNYELNENGQVVAYGKDEDDYATDVLAAKAQSFIRANAGAPLFLYVAPSAPHSPAVPAPRHKALFEGATGPQTAAFDEADVSDKPAYIRARARLTTAEKTAIDRLHRLRLQSLQAVDEMIESLVVTLEELGELENSYIFVTSDNGWMQGQHRIPTGKEVPYDESTRSLLFVRGPGIASGAISKSLVGNIDLAPTFAALAGIAAPEYVDGRSLAPELVGRLESGRMAYLVEHWPMTGDAEGNGLQIPEYGAVRTPDSLYVEYATGEREYYLLSSDPYLLLNVAASAPSEVLAAHAALLARLRGCAREACRTAEDAGAYGATAAPRR